MLEYMRGKDGVHRQMTQLSLSNSLVEKEAFDNVYSDRHAHMDTAGHLHSSTLVPCSTRAPAAPIHQISSTARSTS
jgi:hypothetical protein